MSRRITPSTRYKLDHEHNILWVEAPCHEYINSPMDRWRVVLLGSAHNQYSDYRGRWYLHVQTHTRPELYQYIREHMFAEHSDYDWIEMIVIPPRYTIKRSIARYHYEEKEA